MRETDARQITSADGVDWQALWQEFNFDGVDAIGNQYIEPQKLCEALRVTEQPVGGDVRGIIGDAVQQSILHVQTRSLSDEAEGDEARAGYLLVGGGGDE